MAVFTKIGALIVAVLVIALVANTVLEIFYPSASPSFGVTFSPRYAKYLKLDWQQTFIKILNETNVKRLRLTGYWEDIEAQPGQYNFTDVDFMLDKAAEKDARVMLVLGARQPRWPECHIPAWARELTVTERQSKLLQFIEKVVQRYKDNPQIWAWQVENEPLLSFGEGCDKPDKSFLKKEVELVKSKSSKTIIMTDSGELGFWATSMSLSDVFGTTVYRQVHDKFFGYITYPAPPYFYNVKSNVIRSLFAPENTRTIIVELQAEPWMADGIFASPDKQAKVFTVKALQDYINFAQKTGFDEVYLWGVEWWYFMAANGHPEYLDYTKTLLR